jgi:RimJ/RimL family protein N-acetyltransferase
MTTLRTGRCELRPVAPADAAELHALWITPGVRKFLWDDDLIPPARAAEAVATSRELFDRHRFGLWAVRVNGAPAIQGFAGIWPFRDPPAFELLFGMAEPLWGRGYAVEAARAVLAYCAAVLDMPLVRASTDAGNAASIRVLDKLGFRRVRRATIAGLDTIFFERGAMPIKSKAQRRKFAQLLMEGKITPETFEEWNREAGYRELPERVRPKKKASVSPKRGARRRTTRKSATRKTTQRKTTRKRTSKKR